MNALRWIAAAVLLAGTPLPQRLPKMTADAWTADVDTFARELPKRHPDVFHAISRERFDAAVADLRAKAGKVSDDEMIAGLSGITAMVGDAHTRVHLPVGMHRLPIAVGLFEKDYRVTRASPEAKALLGGKIVRIGDMEIVDVERRLRRVISQDESEAFVRGQLPAQIVSAEMLHGLGVIPDAKRAKVTAATADGEKTLELWTIPAGTNPGNWPSASSAETPLFRRNVDDPLYAIYLEPSKTVYANFHGYDDLASRSKALWKLVDGKAPRKIVVDLRQNGGGDFKLGRKYLVEELKDRPKIKAYVLVGNRTFSAAMANAIDFRDAGATLVGETIGEKPNSYQENDEMVLPHSKLVVSYSTKLYKFLPDGQPSTVTPEKVIAPTWDDFVAGRDPVLDWVLAR